MWEIERLLFSYLQFFVFLRDRLTDWPLSPADAWTCWVACRWWPERLTQLRALWIIPITRSFSEDAEHHNTKLKTRRLLCLVSDEEKTSVRGSVWISVQIYLCIVSLCGFKVKYNVLLLLFHLSVFYLFVQQAGATAGRWTESQSAGSGRGSPTPGRKESVITQLPTLTLKPHIYSNDSHTRVFEVSGRFSVARQCARQDYRHARKPLLICSTSPKCGETHILKLRITHFLK